MDLSPHGTDAPHAPGVDAGRASGEPDLTPRAVVAPAAGKRRRNLGAVVALCLIVVAGGFILVRGLMNATNYYCNADQVGKSANCTPPKRFRLQGAVVPGSVRDQDRQVSFEVAFNGVTIPVEYTGAPPDLFKEGIPVVLEGRMTDSTFQADGIEVKHSEEYKAKNPDRVSPDGP